MRVPVDDEHADEDREHAEHVDDVEDAERVEALERTPLEDVEPFRRALGPYVTISPPKPSTMSTTLASIARNAASPATT
jgi:hypothetical protein